MMTQISVDPPKPQSIEAKMLDRAEFVSRFPMTRGGRYDLYIHSMMSAPGRQFSVRRDNEDLHVPMKQGVVGIKENDHRDFITKIMAGIDRILLYSDSWIPGEPKRHRGGGIER